MGVVEPQREIVRKICPQFREMDTARRRQLLLRRRVAASPS